MASPRRRNNGRGKPITTKLARREPGMLDYWCVNGNDPMFDEDDDDTEHMTVTDVRSNHEIVDTQHSLLYTCMSGFISSSDEEEYEGQSVTTPGGERYVTKKRFEQEMRRRRQPPPPRNMDEAMHRQDEDQRHRNMDDSKRHSRGGPTRRHRNENNDTRDYDNHRNTNHHNSRPNHQQQRQHSRPQSYEDDNKHTGLSLDTDKYGGGYKIDDSQLLEAAFSDDDDNDDDLGMNSFDSDDRYKPCKRRAGKGKNTHLMQRPISRTPSPTSRNLDSDTPKAPIMFLPQTPARISYDNNVDNEDINCHVDVNSKEEEDHYASILNPTPEDPTQNKNSDLKIDDDIEAKHYDSIMNPPVEDVEDLVAKIRGGPDENSAVSSVYEPILPISRNAVAPPRKTRRPIIKAGAKEDEQGVEVGVEGVKEKGSSKDFRDLAAPVPQERTLAAMLVATVDKEKTGELTFVTSPPPAEKKKQFKSLATFLASEAKEGDVSDDEADEVISSKGFNLEAEELEKDVVGTIMKSFSDFGDGIMSSVQKNVKSSIETSGSTFSEMITSVMSGDHDDPVPPKTSTTFSGMISSVLSQDKSEAGIATIGSNNNIVSVMSQDLSEAGIAASGSAVNIFSVLSQDKSEAGIAKIGSGDNIVSAMSQDKSESGITILESADDIVSVMSQDNGEEVGIATIGSTLGLSTSSVQNADNYQAGVESYYIDDVLSSRSVDSNDDVGTDDKCKDHGEITVDLKVENVLEDNYVVTSNTVNVDSNEISDENEERKEDSTYDPVMDIRSEDVDITIVYSDEEGDLEPTRQKEDVDIDNEMINERTQHMQSIVNHESIDRMRKLVEDCMENVEPVAPLPIQNNLNTPVITNTCGRQFKDAPNVDSEPSIKEKISKKADVVLSEQEHIDISAHDNGKEKQEVKPALDDKPPVSQATPAAKQKSDFGSLMFEMSRAGNGLQDALLSYKKSGGIINSSSAPNKEVTGSILLPKTASPSLTESKKFTSPALVSPTVPHNRPLSPCIKTKSLRISSPSTSPPSYRRPISPISPSRVHFPKMFRAISPTSPSRARPVTPSSVTSVSSNDEDAKMNRHAAGERVMAATDKDNALQMFVDQIMRK